MVWGWVRNGNPWSRQRPVPRVTILKNCVLYVSVCKNHMETFKRWIPQVPAPEILRRPQDWA